MRLGAMFLTATAAMLPFAPAVAAERGVMRIASELKTKPFIDAPSSGKLAVNQKINVTGRQGAWAQVDASGQNGWVRALSFTLESGSAPIGQSAGARRGNVKGLTAPANFFTGSSSKEATTGVKGLTAKDIQDAEPNLARVAQLASFAVDSSEASTNAQQSGLKEQQIAYLKGGKK